MLLAMNDSDRHLDVTGRWTGTWTGFNPAHDAAPPADQRRRMDAFVSHDGDVWTTKFEADCGGDYTYTVTMEGRQIGAVVMFRATTDLGEKGGGVFDWIARANDREFIGFYTSAEYTGIFSLARAQ